tara:strand:+ start:1332 stop:1625 length:294 start_codon:yes stop_codon:yes gene_type:complete
MDTYILRKSNRKGKRFVIDMPRYNHSHHFGSDVGKTFIDHQDIKKKNAWVARHKNDKGYNNKHSGIYHSRKLLWTEPTLKQAIKKYEKEHNVRIILK